MMKLKILTVSVILSILTTTCVYAEKKVQNEYDIVDNKVKKDIKNPEKKISNSSGYLIVKNNALVCDTKKSLLEMAYFAGNDSVQKLIEFSYCSKIIPNEKYSFNEIYQSKSGAGDVLKIIGNKSINYLFKSDVEMKNSTNTTTSSNRYITSWGNTDYSDSSYIWKKFNIKLNTGDSIWASLRKNSLESNDLIVSGIGTASGSANNGWAYSCTNGSSRQIGAHNKSAEDMIKKLVKECN